MEQLHLADLYGVNSKEEYDSYVADVRRQNAEHTAKQATTTSAPVSPQDKVAPQSSEQKEFLNKIDEFREQYRSKHKDFNVSADKSTNEVALSIIRKNPSKYLSSVNRKFTDWTVTLECLSTGSDGDAYASFRMGHPRARESFENSVDEALAKSKDGYVFFWTKIDRDDELYDLLAKANVNDRYLISGEMLKPSLSLLKSDDDDVDYLDEGSMTEKGSMFQPEFKVSLSSIQKM